MAAVALRDKTLHCTGATLKTAWEESSGIQAAVLAGAKSSRRQHQYSYAEESVKEEVFF